MRVLAFFAVSCGILGLVLFAMVQRDLRRNRWPPPTESRVPDQPVSFGYKIVWFAVKSHEAERIAAVLGSRELVPCNWATGIDRAYGHDVFLTPPISDWTLAVGFELPSAEADGGEQRVAGTLEQLSREFGEAQWFATHGSIEYHGWARYIDGKPIRFFSYSGKRREILHNAGEHQHFEPADLSFADQSMVMRAAAEWSVDPRGLEERTGVAGTGWLAHRE